MAKPVVVGIILKYEKIGVLYWLQCFCSLLELVIIKMLYFSANNLCIITFNWRMFAVLLSVAVIVQFTPNTDYHPLVFFIAGFICFIPGAYHVVYIYLAAKGHPGYSFYSLSLFN